MSDDDRNENDPITASDEMDDVVLNAVDDAIAAVENQTPEEPAQAPAKSPSNVIPELDDVEDTEEMVQVLLTVGEERSRRDDVKGALAAFNKAIALDPSCDMAWFNRGVLLEAQQDARGARQSFQICLDLNDQHAPATANMAILLERIGDLEGAYDMAERALAFFPGHPALVELQARCKDSGLSVAMESMQPSVQVTQEVDMKLVEQVASEAGIENPEELLHEAVHHDHDDDATLSEEELKSAAEVVVAQHEVTRESEPASDDGTESSSEVAALDETVEPSPAPAEPEAKAPALDIDALTEEATELLKAGESKQALALLKPHLKTVAAQHAGAWRIAGGAMARLELDNHAIAAMTHAQNLEPDHAPGWFNLGSVQQRNGHIQEAIKAYGRAVDADETYGKAAEKMVAVAKENGLIEPYMDSVRRLLAIEPDHEERHELVKMLLQLAQGESDVLEQGTGLPPTLPAGPEMAAEALTLMEDRASPERALALSLSLQHSDAVLMWKSLIQQDQQSPENWVGLARALEQAGDLETASKCHAKAAALGGENQAFTETTPSESIATEPDMAMSTQPTGAPLEPVEQLGDEEAATSVMMEPLMHEDSDEPVNEVGQEAANDLLLTPVDAVREPAEPEVRPEVDLAKAALDAAQAVAVNTPQNTTSKAIANQDVAWFNQGIQLIEDKKYREALSCFDKALPAFAGDDAMIIRILNNRGNAYYLLEEYPKCVEAYHQAMLIRPTEVRGDTLYNMGTAYSMMGRYNDAIKCFEQAIPRGLSDEAVRSAKDQIRRCNILQKAVDKKKKRK